MSENKEEKLKKDLKRNQLMQAVQAEEQAEEVERIQQPSMIARVRRERKTAQSTILLKPSVKQQGMERAAALDLSFSEYVSSLIIKDIANNIL